MSRNPSTPRDDVRVTSSTCIIRCSPTRSRVLASVVDRLMGLDDVVAHLDPGGRRSIQAAEGRIHAAAMAGEERDVVLSHYQVRALVHLLTVAARVTSVGYGLHNGDKASLLGAARALEYASQRIPMVAVGDTGKSDPGAPSVHGRRGGDQRHRFDQTAERNAAGLA